ncbi:hypothetical protein [Bosea sp. CS1GBMeth4]|uniref:hypothetical protein n=1 Tax=Bosea sp. CS1GBMeth4 TaxID=1892849 RepID=UPI001FCF28B1|nr:hypothetical protein [Bosea sp. CS1GBMeth4]
MNATIRSQDDYEAALARIRELRTSPATVSETSELKQLLDAADEWDRTSGGEAAGERDDMEALSVQTSASFALKMAGRFPRRDWVADIADLLGKDRDYVEWHLQHDTMPPQDLLTAATRLIAGERPARRAAAEQGHEAPSPIPERAPPLPEPDRPGEADEGRVTSRLRSVANILVSGTAVSLATSAVLSVLARLEGRSAVQPVNSTSHWYWGEAAGRSRRLDAPHTIVGFATHHGASLFWACAYELLRRHPGRRAAFGDAVAVSTLAAVVDYAVVPKRLTPGWEKVVSPAAIGAAYAAMALALALSPRVGGRGRS